jgi:hypothetical protein
MVPRRRSAYEWVVIGGVVALAIIIGAALTSARAKVEKGNLLVDELQAMRQAIVTFKMIRGAYPDSLSDLTAMTFDAGNGDGRPYLEGVPEKDKGRLLDPFGSPYVYDPARGWVRSQSPGYERW